MNPVISFSNEYSYSITGSGHLRGLRCSKGSQLLAVLLVIKEYCDPSICDYTPVKDEATLGQDRISLPLSLCLL